MVCGEDLFNFWKLDALVADVTERPKAGEYLQRNRELTTRPGASRSSFYFDMISAHEMGRPEASETIWSLVLTFSCHYCSDPRDRVFGLIALADPESRRAFSPDYTKTAITVLLQLVEHHAQTTERRDLRDDFNRAHEIIGALGFGLDNLDIAAMCDRRRTDVRREDPFSGNIARREQFIREAHARSSYRLPRHLIPKKGLGHIIMMATSHCTVWKNEVGDIVAPLLRRPSTARQFGDSTRFDFSAGQESPSDGISLHTPGGSVVGLANKLIQPGDTLLLFESCHREEMFHSALVVRRYESAVAAIVGQCLVDWDVGTCQGGSGCVCRDATHITDEETCWKVLMSPEDLLLFIAQDLKLVHRRPSKFEVPMVDVSVNVDQSRERLRTRVTSEEFSSYAMAI